VDSELLVDQPIVALRNGQASGIPLLAGYNRDEMKPVAILPPIAQHRSMGWDEFWRRLRDVYSDPEIHALQQLYPQTDYDNVVSLWTDVFEYLYAFDVGTRSYGIEPYMGSFHSLELSYVFGNYAMLDLFFHESNSAERIIEQSEMIQRYWTRFARTGDPNGGGDPVWPRFGAERVSLQLSPTPRVTPGLKGPQCDFWSTRLPIEFSAMFDYMMKVPRNAGIGVDFNEMLGLAGGDGE
jgi:para-nitrobenzyl esterase